MSRRHLMGGLAGLALSGAWLAGQTPPTFRAGADFVSVDVSVQQGGRPVTGLAVEDFELLDNGIPQVIADMSYETLPIDVTVALDVSDSVTGAVLEQLRQSVRELARQLADRDRLRLLTFNVRISRALDFGAPVSAIDAAFDRIRPFGGTAVFDTIAVALATPSTPDRRHLVVVFSDGDDSLSITTPDELFDLAQRTTPTVSAVLASPRLQTRGSPAAARNRVPIYTRLADETGGLVESVDAGESLDPTFRRMLTAFRRSYILHFVPRGVEPSGFHTLTVRVKDRDADVRARRGYTWK